MTMTSIAWRLVPAGHIILGSTDDDPDAWYDERPQHRLYLPDFFISAYPITNQQYRTYVDATRSEKPKIWFDGSFEPEKGNHPVTGINWHEARAFAHWLARQHGELISLPNEAEWEKAARGSDGRLYPWGNHWDAYRCNSGETGLEGTTPVDAYPDGRSPYDVYDMIGNVWEWTDSIYLPYPIAVAGAEQETEDNGKRTLRGGAWAFERNFCRATTRMVGPADNRNSLAGFRLARHLPTP